MKNFFYFEYSAQLAKNAVFQKFSEYLSKSPKTKACAKKKPIVKNQIAMTV